MSSRILRTTVLALSASVAVLAGSALMGGCSEETNPVGGSDAGDSVDANKPKDSAPADEEDAGLTVEECLQACETKHAVGLAKDQAIDQCWETKCSGPCIDDTEFDAGAAGGDGGAPMCKEEVLTATDSCDLCTQTYCCAAWDACFQDDDCVALNTCRNACVD
jgi:hypothetical protein